MCTIVRPKKNEPGHIQLYIDNAQFPAEYIDAKSDTNYEIYFSETEDIYLDFPNVIILIDISESTICGGQLPKSLTCASFTYTVIKNMPQFGPLVNLRKLYMIDCKLKYMPCIRTQDWPPNLILLNLSNNNIREIPPNSLPPRLKTLLIGHNELIEFNIAHDNITCLHINHNTIRNIHILPPNLRELHFHSNFIELNGAAKKEIAKDTISTIIDDIMADHAEHKDNMADVANYIKKHNNVFPNDINLPFIAHIGDHCHLYKVHLNILKYICRLPPHLDERKSKVHLPYVPRADNLASLIWASNFNNIVNALQDELPSDILKLLAHFCIDIIFIKNMKSAAHI